MANKYIGKGADVAYSTTANGPWTIIPSTETIGEIRSVSAQVNVSDLLDDEDTFIAGRKSPQSVQYSIFWDPEDATHQDVRDHAVAGTSLFFRNRWRDTTDAIISTAIYGGIILEIGFGPTSGTEALKMPIVVQRSGGITWS